jgi:hypothetical protein
MLCMSDAAVSERARRKAFARWGATRPVRLAEELRRRASELPPTDREQLRAALEQASSEPLGGAA